MKITTEHDPDLVRWLASVRHDFHQYPEIAFNEIRTTQKIKALLTRMGIAPDGSYDSETGVIAVLRGSRPGKTIAVRADIDALPIFEQTGLDYASKNSGVMHACGHDAHIAIALGTARVLSARLKNQDFSGNIKFIFQPAEETLSGAVHMIEKGALNEPGVDAVISCHVVNTLNTGKVDTLEGPVFAAADNFTLTLEGKGCHAAYPHKGKDPILAGCEFVSGCISLIRRHVNPVDTCVISTGTFNAGEASNIIPGRAVLTGSIRTYDTCVRHKVIENLKQMLNSIELNHGVNASLELRKAAPALINDPDIASLLTRAASRVVGKENIVKTKPFTGSEDFACYLENVPGAMFMLGAKNRDDEIATQAHSPDFVLDDQALPVGVGIMVETCSDFLNLSH